MPRKRFQSTDKDPFHISARLNNKDWFSIPMPEAWALYSDHLHIINRRFGANIHAFVLMNNHYHLLARFPENNLSEAMAYFQRETSRELGRRSMRINHAYGGRFFRSRIGSYHYYMHAYKYLYRNPIEAGLCETVHEYPYSTLSGLLGRYYIFIPMIEDTLLFGDVEGTLQWLNRPPDPEHRDLIRKALRRSEFKLPKNRHNKKPHELEYELY